MFASLVFHHLPPTLKQCELAEIQRVLKPGGRLLLVDFLKPSRRLFLHSSLQEGLQDILPLLNDTGFLQVEWKPGPFPQLGYIRGRTAHK